MRSILYQNVDDVSVAGIPVAYLTVQLALNLAGFQAGKTVVAPAIGGSIGNAMTQLARALDTKRALSSTTNHAKGGQAKTLGFNEVVKSFATKATGPKTQSKQARADSIFHYFPISANWFQLSAASSEC